MQKIILLVLLCSLSCLSAQIEKPLVQVLIPSLKTAVEHAGQIADRFMPGMKDQLAPMLQQSLPPGVYDAIAPDQTLAFIFFAPEAGLNVENSFAVVLPLKSGLSAQTAFASLGAPAIQQIQNYAVLGMPGAVARVRPEHLQFAPSTFDVLIQVSFGEEWRALLSDLEAELNASEKNFLSDILMGVYKATQSLTQQMTALDIKVSLSSEAVTCEAEMHVQPGTLLHQLAQSTQSFDGFLLNTENTHMLMSINLPPKEFEMMLQGLLQFIRDLHLGPEIEPLLTTYFSLIGPYYANAQMTLRMNGAQGMNISYLCKNFTLEQYLQVMEKVQGINWQDLFKFTGVEMNMKFSQELKRNTRTFDGVAIHQHQFNMEFEGPMAELQNTMLRSMYGDNGMSFELAEVSSYLLFSDAKFPEDLDVLIQKIKNLGTLVPGPKHLIHCEIDLIGYYASILSMMQGQFPAEIGLIVEALNSVQSRDRVVVRVSPSEKGINHSLRIPLSPIVEVTQAILQLKQDNAVPMEEVEVSTEDEELEHD